MKHLMIALAMVAALLSACNYNNNPYGATTTPTAAPTTNPALGTTIVLSMVANYATPSPNPSATATAIPSPAAQTSFAFGPATSPPLTASLSAIEQGYSGALTLTLTNCANPAPISVTPKAGNPLQVSPVLYTVTDILSGQCTISVTDGIGHTSTILVSVP